MSPNKQKARHYFITREQIVIDGDDEFVKFDHILNTMGIHTHFIEFQSVINSQKFSTKNLFT